MSILEMDEEEGIISPFYYEKVRDHTLQMGLCQKFQVVAIVANGWGATKEFLKDVKKQISILQQIIRDDKGDQYMVKDRNYVKLRISRE